MQILLEGVSSTENLFEGTDTQGNRFKLTGTFIHGENISFFKDAQITEGPEHLKGQPCEAVIQDTTAKMIVFGKLSRNYTRLIRAA